MNEGTSPLIASPPPNCIFCRQAWEAGAKYGVLFCSECEPERFVESCEHGVMEGDWCEPCNKEYKRAEAEFTSTEPRS